MGNVPSCNLIEFTSDNYLEQLDRKRLDGKNTNINNLFHISSVLRLSNTESQFIFRMLNQQASTVTYVSYLKNTTFQESSSRRAWGSIWGGGGWRDMYVCVYG